MICNALHVQQDELLDEKVAAQILGVTPGTLQVWRSTGRYGIPFIKVGRLVRYRRSALNHWIDSRTRESGATE
ncbi:MAG: helix-turn-helix domain-containing protein [Rhodocyclaceae bacterium]|nr:helix-turn-helix domain-containing protein [Rhodocyclaceae bacterium]